MNEPNRSMTQEGECSFSEGVMGLALLVVREEDEAVLDESEKLVGGSSAKFASEEEDEDARDDDDVDKRTGVYETMVELGLM